MLNVGNECRKKTGLATLFWTKSSGIIYLYTTNRHKTFGRSIQGHPVHRKNIHNEKRDSENSGFSFLIFALMLKVLILILMFNKTLGWIL